MYQYKNKKIKTSLATKQALTPGPKNPRFSIRQWNKAERTTTIPHITNYRLKM